MAELIEKNNVIPHRLFALISVVNAFTVLPRADILRLIQPETLNESLETSASVYSKCLLCGLITEAEDKQRSASLAVDVHLASDYQKFREYIQSNVLGVTQEQHDHWVLNLFAAWFVVQNEWPLNNSKTNWEIKFNSDLFPSFADRIISEHPGITTWMEWAEFLGWGWLLKFGREETTFAPDCTIRLLPLLSEVLPEAGMISFGSFIERLSVRCPELDGGVLFERCWQACRPQEQRGNRLSLMLSTGLRVLNQRGEITLETQADATEVWTLFPAQSYISRVTHIRRGNS